MALAAGAETVAPVRSVSRHELPVSQFMAPSAGVETSVVSAESLFALSVFCCMAFSTGMEIEPIWAGISSKSSVFCCIMLIPCWIISVFRCMLAVLWCLLSVFCRIAIIMAPRFQSCSRYLLFLLPAGCLRSRNIFLRRCRVVLWSLPSVFLLNCTCFLWHGGNDTKALTGKQAENEITERMKSYLMHKGRRVITKGAVRQVQYVQLNTQRMREFSWTAGECGLSKQMPRDAGVQLDEGRVQMPGECKLDDGKAYLVKTNVPAFRVFVLTKWALLPGSPDFPRLRPDYLELHSTIQHPNPFLNS